MNHQYRVIFNRTLGVRQAVSEGARCGGQLGGGAVTTSPGVAAQGGTEYPRWWESQAGKLRL
ncbi:MAG: ESPR domain-containing protein [Polaromonas sp.]|uniref:ESPR domain-containing protein n=1 Tax=Polaromonas sp. TaxID=1869339 RepID=UPI003264E0AE